MHCLKYMRILKVCGIVATVCLFCALTASSAGVPVVPVMPFMRVVSTMPDVMPNVVHGPASPWVSMPAGAKYAYIGIHGGTVPVSLLAASDGQSMVTFVGRTGNDFLSLLRAVTLQRPGGVPEHANQPERNATILMADTAIGNVPVFYHTGMGFARIDLDTERWLPFGLSEKPLGLEGQAGRTLPQTGAQTAQTAQNKHKKYRRVQWQQRLQRPVLASQ